MPGDDPFYFDPDLGLTPGLPDIAYAAQDELMASFDPLNWFPVDMPELQPDPGPGLGMGAPPADNFDPFDMQEFEEPPDFPDEQAEEFDEIDTRVEPCGSGGCPDRQRPPEPDALPSSDRPGVIALPAIPYDAGQGWYEPTDRGGWAVGYDSPRYITVDPEPEIATPVSPYQGVPVTQAHSIKES